jgi:hypothetical protein
MASRTTFLPDGPRMKAFRALERVLREDPALAGAVKTWASWRGDGLDKMPLASGMMPYIRLSPVVMPSEIMGVGRSVAVLGVRVEVGVAGLVAEDIVNLWDAVEDAVVREKPFGDTTVMCFLQREGGAFFHRAETPGIDAWQTKDNPPQEFLAGAGMIVLRISRPA